MFKLFVMGWILLAVDIQPIDDFFEIFFVLEHFISLCQQQLIGSCVNHSGFYAR